MPENLPRVGSALLVRDEANRILLGKRNKDPLRGSWVIPGGKIHAFESIADAAARELQEETGLIVEVGDHFNVYEIINPPNEHRIVIYSWGIVVGGEARASDDISELKFFELAELGNVPVTPLVKRVLADAGLVGTLSIPVSNQQLAFTAFPVPLVGVAQRQHSRRVRGYMRGRRTSPRNAIIRQSSLAFEPPLR